MNKSTRGFLEVPIKMVLYWVKCFVTDDCYQNYLFFYHFLIYQNYAIMIELLIVNQMKFFLQKKSVPLDNSLTHKGLHSDDSRITSQIDKSVLQ